MSERNEKREPLEELAAEFMERLRCGETPSIDAYAEAHPDLADEIHDLFPTIASLERLKVQKEVSSDGRASLGAVKLDRLGDYRIIREIGRGGMGIVYEAEQESLGRHVAIKVLPRHSLLDPKHLERFRKEAQIAAGLHHTNIVPVFGVGEHEGFHYIVMQVIPGVGLDKVLAGLATGVADQGKREEPGLSGLGNGAAADQPQLQTSVDFFLQSVQPAWNRFHPAGSHYWKKVAAVGMQAARALHHAHRRDTLHRDIKPANLLVDGGGCVWITDFGVAKVMQEGDVTRTGDMVGTLRYMAPERFEGRTETRSDLYSLGLTLYEFVTFQPAFDAEDQSSLIRRITHGESAPPRKSNPHIPRDLDTIILKSIARDPEHRYVSAEALAHDLECFLEDRPIEARPITSIERFWRWCRRNPVVASLASAVSCLLVVVAVVAIAAYLHTRAAGLRTGRALQGEKEQRKKSEATAALALEVLDRIYAQFAPREFTSSPGRIVGEMGSDEIEVPVYPVVSKETAFLLENLLVFYDRLAEQGSRSVQLRQEAALANQRMGSIRKHLGQFDLAEAAYQRALDKYRELAEQNRDSRKDAWKTALIHNELGSIRRLMSRLDEAYASHQQALDLLEAALSLSSDDPAILLELARTHFLMGSRSWLDLGPMARAPPRGPPPGEGDPMRRDRERPGMPRRLPRDDDMRRPPPDPDRPGTSGSDGRDPHPPDHEARMERERSMRQRAQSHLESAIDLLKALRSEYPSIPAHGHLLACCYREMSSLLDFSPSVLDDLNEAIEILDDLAGSFPDVPGYRYDLALTCGAWDVRRMPHDLLPRAEGGMERALEILEELVAEFPNVPSYVMLQVQIRHKLAGLYRHMDRRDAVSCLRKAVQIQSSLVGRFPEVLAYRVWHAEIQLSLARFLADQGEGEEARALGERAVEILEAIVEEGSELLPGPRLLEGGYMRLADILRLTGDDEAADELIDSAREMNRLHRER